MTLPLQLIFVDSSPNDVEEMVTAIKTSGMAVRSRIAKDANELTSLLKETQPHIVLHSTESKNNSLEQTITTINGRAPEIPVIAVTNSDEENPVSFMVKGASSLVNRENTELFKLVINTTAKTQFHIQKLKCSAEIVEELESRCKRLMESSRDAICYIHEGMHTYANQKYLELFGFSDIKDVEGLSIMELVTPDDHQKIKNVIKNISKSSESGEIDLNFFREDKESFSAKLNYTSVVVAGEDCAQVIIHKSEDDSDSKELQEQLSYLSERDLGTGFYHRRSILNLLEKAIEKVKQSEEVTQTFIQIDIANFTDIKDKFGLAAIDKVGAEVANALRSCCSKDETLSKLTEDSFGILTSDTDVNSLKDFGSTIVKALNDLTITSGGDYISVRPAVGATHIDQFSKDLTDVLNKTKTCCDEAWENESNELLLFTPDDKQMGEYEKDERWTAQLREAIKENRLAILFQPIISLHGEPGERYQIYTAVKNKDGNLIPASEFILRIERTGFGKMVDRWVILHAFKQLGEQLNKGTDMRFFIKLTANSLLDTEFIDWLTEQIGTNNITPAHVCLELKEHILISHLKEAKIFVERLKEINCEFAIDAFGSGDKPTKILNTIPADYVKICNSVMSGLSENQENQAAIREITEELKPQGIKVIAQFVEDADTLSTLWSLGINYTQGNFLQPASDQPSYDFSSM